MSTAAFRFFLLPYANVLSDFFELRAIFDILGKLLSKMMKGIL